MYEFIKEWFNKLIGKEPEKPVFGYTLYPKEDMNKYTFSTSTEMRAFVVRRACTPILLAMTLDSKKVCIDFTGGAYGSSFLKKMAYEIAEEIFQFYSEKPVGSAIPSTALRNITVLNSEDPTIVVEFIEYLREAEGLFLAKYYGITS